MNLRLTLALLTFVPMLTLSAADADEAQKKLHSAVDEVLDIAGRASDMPSLITKLTPVLERNISFTIMTRRAVGPGWRDFKPAEQEKATELFTKLVIRSYCNKFTIGEHPEVKYTSTTNPAAGRVDCNTTIIYQGNRYTVVYRMEKEVGWNVTDVVIEGVSMVANYRTQLDPVFKKGGASAVLSSLEQSVARSK